MIYLFFLTHIKQKIGHNSFIDDIFDFHTLGKNQLPFPSFVLIFINFTSKDDKSALSYKFVLFGWTIFFFNLNILIFFSIFLNI